MGSLLNRINDAFCRTIIETSRGSPFAKTLAFATYRGLQCLRSAGEREGEKVRKDVEVGSCTPKRCAGNPTSKPW